MWDNAKNILCVRLDSMGDVLMTSPAFRALKESRPERKLTLLTSQSGALIAPLIPEIDDVIVFDPPWMKASEQHFPSALGIHIIHQLRRRNFDAAIIFTVFSQNPLAAAYLCYLAEIPLRLGYCRENPYQLLNSWLKETDTENNMRHEVRRQLDLVAFIGCKTADDRLSVRIPEIPTRSVASLLQNQSGFNPYKPWLIIHPGATAESRRYPHYASVANELAQKGLQILFTGLDSERDLVEGILESLTLEARAQSLSLVDRLNLAEMAALIEIAPLLITNNTGPAHLAAALETPVVVLYALINPQHTPWKGISRVLFRDVPCRNCFKSICPQEHQNCLRLVEPQMVVAAAMEFLC